MTRFGGFYLSPGFEKVIAPPCSKLFRGLIAIISGASCIRAYWAKSLIYIKSRKLLQKVFPVVFQFVNGFIHIRQGGMQLTLFKTTVNLGPPAFGQLLEGAHIHIAVVKKCFEFRHVLD